MDITTRSAAATQAPGKRRRSNGCVRALFYGPVRFGPHCNSIFSLRAHATWQKARSQPSGGQKVQYHKKGALFRVKPSGWDPSLMMPTIELVT